MGKELYHIKYFSFFILLVSFLLTECETGFTEINDLCIHEGDLGVIQKMIYNSY